MNLLWIPLFVRLALVALIARSFIVGDFGFGLMLSGLWLVGMVVETVLRKRRAS